MADPLTTPDRARPRPWTVIGLGLFHENAAILILVVGFVPIAFLIAARNQLSGLPVFLLVTVAYAVIVLGLGRHLVMAPLARLLKRLFTRSFDVLYLRSFRPEDAHPARDSLSPILGCMGTLTTVHNPDFIQGLTIIDGHDGHEDLTLAWLELGEILSDGLEAVKLTGDWRDGVRTLLDRTDLVVIDLTAASPHVAWELVQAQTALPAERLIALRAAGTPASTPAKDVLEYELSQRGRWHLRRALARRLARIAGTARH